MILAPTIDPCVTCIQKSSLLATEPALYILTQSIQTSVVRSDAREAIVP